MSRVGLAASALAVPGSGIRRLANLAMEMDAANTDPEDRVLRLYFGESSVPTPEFIKRAAQKAMADGYTFYTENAGLPSTRAAVARYYAERHGVTLDPMTRIVVTASGGQAMNVSMRCVLDPGDEAIVLTPAWPNGSSIVQMANAVVKQIGQPLLGDRYGIDFDAVEAAITPRTRLILYTSPSNPTGWVATEADQERLLELTRKHGMWLIADEVYERLNYVGAKLGDAAPSILRKASAEDAVVVVQSFSKSYCMTGWRVGWLVSRTDLCERAGQLNEFIISHAPSFAQRAGETALLWGEASVLELVARLKENRDFCLAALKKMPGMNVPQADGAFYLFPRVEGLTDSFEFCRRLLVETKVGLAPGAAFGPGGEGAIRICYAAERPILEKAMARLAGFVRG